jgi:hypothetical protein
MSLAKIFDPVLKVAARTYQGMLASELNKMGEYFDLKRNKILNFTIRCLVQR